ncbi:MAG: class I SAM-dependent methyltransferase [Chitinophagaceae bacterium]|nr:class I SAM-dependent methyltransferase [Chitinophagaceae bacterium]
MKFFRYIQYFFYVGLNWGWRVAFAIIAQEIAGEKKYRIDTTGADELVKLKKTGIDVSHATMYMPVSYTLLEKTLGEIRPDSKNHFLDIGCGKGRAMCLAAHCHFNKISGVDFSAVFCIKAIRNLSLTKQQFPDINFSVTEQDAATYCIPEDVDCIFMFNPFDEIIMKKVVDNIMRSLKANPRTLNIIYANPLYKNLFINNNFKEVYYSKTLQQFEVSILNCRQQ